jgi:hypothetical protein
LKFKEGIFYEKIAILCTYDPMWRAVLVKRMAADRSNTGRSNFFDHFKLKIENKFGTFSCKKLKRPKLA